VQSNNKWPQNVQFHELKSDQFVDLDLQKEMSMFSLHKSFFEDGNEWHFL
jgi:hypothetical protein